MKNSRDVTIIIMFAVLSFVFQALIGQVPSLITGIPGIGYAFTIIYSIIQSVAYLMYEGRRWRIVAQTLVINLLALLPIIPNWTLPVAMASIVNSFIVDSIFNSLYGKFKRDNRLFWWILLVQVYYWMTLPFWLLPFFSLFYPLERFLAEWFIPVMSIMLPITIVEAVAGSYLGYGIYRRVEKLSNT